jgi:site-specific DNA-cytosine methylase
LKSNSQLNNKNKKEDKYKLMLIAPNEWGSSKPKILVLENSPHLKDGEGGLWFRTIQTEIQRSGYWFGASSSFILDTRENGGLPQRRKRLFMIAVNQDFFDFNPFNLKDVAPKLGKGRDKTKQDKAAQEKAGQGKARQDKT